MLIRAVIVFFLVNLSGVAWAAPPQGYYSSTEGLTGQELKAALHQIIDGHTVYPYTKKGNLDYFDGKDIDVWEALVFTDSACPDDNLNCGDVQLLYLDETRNIEDRNRGKGEHDSWDREHVWPKSRGFEKNWQDGYTDLHHLRPADRDLNGKHSNYGYDVGGKPVVDKRNDGSQTDSGARLDKDGESFEPPDRAKGQVARMLFYMAVRYEPGDNTNEEGMPDLILLDKNQKVKEPWIGDLCTLVEWNNRFPPTEFEIRRNDRVMQLQGNRNPFIDYPGWVNLVWQSCCSE